MDNERLDTNPSSNHNAKRVTKDRREKVEKLLREGTPVLEVAKEVKMSPNNVTAIKKDMPESTGLVDEFKAVTVRNLKAFVQQASQKLVNELDNLHVSQIPIAMGIAIDKIQTLQDQPQAVVEHRFTVDHASLDKLLKSRGADLRRSKEVVLDAEFESVKPEDTAKFLNWAKDPKGSFLEIKDESINPSALGTDINDRPPPPPSA